MITRSFANGFEVSDYTQELITIPNTWGTLQQLGIFQSVPVAENTVIVEEINKSLTLVGDKARGERANVGKDYARKIRSFFVPHFPLDDSILPTDIQGKRAYARPGEPDNLAEVRARKLEYIRRIHAVTLEFARAKALTTGDIYAPNGTVVGNWFTEFGVTQKVVDVAFATPTTDVAGKIEEALYYVQMNIMNGGVMTGALVLCSREWFSALIAHPKIATAFQYYSSSQEPLRDRLAPGLNISMHRKFEYMGVTFLEMNDQYTDNAGVVQRLIPASTAVMLPLGTDSFVTHFAPANKFEFVNTTGEEAYFFEYPNLKGDKIDIESESNFLSIVRRPAALVRLTMS